MDAKRLLTGTVVGGIVMFILGYLIFQTLFAGFYEANAGTATGVARDARLLLPWILGTLSLAALVTLAIGWSGASSVTEGFKIGATVGFLIWLGIDLLFYSRTHLQTLTISLVDPVLEIVRTGLGGVAIAAILGRTSGGE